ncbi:MAG: ABC transporter permease [Gemmatimonadota bacterium]
MGSLHSPHAEPVRGGALFEAAWQDLRHGARLLRRSPAFAIIAIVTIGLGIGANSAIFSVVNSVVRKPLAYPAADRLMFLTSQFPTLGFDKFWISPPEYFDFVEHTRAFAGVAAYRMGAVNLSGNDRPERVNVASVTATMFTVLGVRARHGQLFTAEQDVPNADPVVVLSHELWQRTFGSDLAVIGQRVQVDGVATTVLGVMPPDFDLHDSKAQLWMPLGLDAANRQNRGSHSLYLVGRLSPGVTPSQATGELNGMLRRWREWAGDTHVPNDSTHRLQMAPLQDEVVGNVRQALWVLQGAVALVLLIACANVANLLLARAESRHREFAVRTALGAGRGRVLQQFIAEGVVVSLLGALVGLGVAYAGLKALLAANPESIPRATEITLDPVVLLLTVGVAIGTGFVFGLAPLLHLGEESVTAAIKEGGARTTASAGRSRMRRGLVVGEIALAVMLVIGAGLLIRTFQNLTSVNAGFDSAGRMTFGLVLPRSVYPDSQRAAQAIVDLTRHLEAIPGVTRAAAMEGLPPVRQVDANDTDFEGYAPKAGDPPGNVDYYQGATAGYMETMGIRLVDGRGFTATDAAGSPVAIINQALARRFFADQNPLGRRIRPGFGPSTPWFTIVGVAADVKQAGLDAPAGTELYFNFEQLPRVLGYVPRQMNLVLQASQPLSALAGSIRSAVAAIDPTLPIVQLRTMDEVIGASLVRQRFLTLLLGIFAVVALLLAAIGTYGILAYMVAERQQEIGIRLALGAGAMQVVRLVLRQGAVIAGTGIVVGLVGALVLARLTRSLLYGVSPFDPLTFATVAGVIVLVAAAACLVPMRRAARVDVLAALRGE